MKDLKEYLKLNESYYLDDYRNSKFDSIKDVLNMFKKIWDEHKFEYNSSINDINWNNINESDFKEISKDELHDIFYSRKKDENTINMVLYKHKESNKFIGFSFNKNIAPLTFIKEHDRYIIDWLGPEPNSFQSTGEWPTKKKFETVAKYDGLSYFYTKIKL